VGSYIVVYKIFVSLGVVYCCYPGGSFAHWTNSSADISPVGEPADINPVGEPPSWLTTFTNQNYYGH